MKKCRKFDGNKTIELDHLLAGDVTLFKYDDSEAHTTVDTACKPPLIQGTGQVV
jgi:hypothetical protein